LRDLLNDFAAIQFKNVQFLSAEIFSALFYLHDNQIIHRCDSLHLALERIYNTDLNRDMKPENILLHEYHNGVHVKLCDFATAKDLTTLEEGQRATTFVGSAEYISPGSLSSQSTDGIYHIRYILFIV